MLAGFMLTRVLHVVKPANFVGGEGSHALDEVTLEFSRFALGIQLVFAGVHLPRDFLRVEWRSLSLLLGPGLFAMWAFSTAIILLLVPNLPILHALAISSCITPTDPVLSASIIEGRFADRNIPNGLRNLILAESGINDGLGYPFLFFSLIIMEYTAVDSNAEGGIMAGLSLFLWRTCLYKVAASVIYGWLVGTAARRLLGWAHEKQYIGRESLVTSSMAMALSILGTCGMAGADDVLACFIAGSVLSWDDWFRVQTMEDSFQHAIDMLLNEAMFMWLGAVCPWESFWNSEVVAWWRLLLVGIAILLFRRLPVILAMHRFIHHIEHVGHALFVGYFGPIGVSATFYLCLGLRFSRRLRHDPDTGALDEMKLLEDNMTVIVWFVVVVSVVSFVFLRLSSSSPLADGSFKVVHGLSVPIGVLGWRVGELIGRRGGQRSFFSRETPLVSNGRLLSESNDHSYGTV